MSSNNTEEPTKIQKLSAQDFLQQAHHTNGLDEWIDKIHEADKRCDDRAMLKVCLFILHKIGHSTDWNTENGLDAVRMDSKNLVILPTWRECIGAILGVEFGPPAEKKTEDD